MKRKFLLDYFTHWFCNSQHGFRSNRSTVSLLLQAVDDWSLCLEHRGTMHFLFLDFAKAFDSVPHERLLLKLNALGIDGNLLNWIRSFLTSRYHRVVINGKFSSCFPVSSVVPQGSILGPLFLVYIDDLPSVVQHSTIKLFADDVAAYTEVKSYEDCKKLQDDLHQIFLWTVKWQLRLNSQKCDALMITRKHSPLGYTYCIDDSPISWKSIVKYLGIHLNSTLNWTDHLQIIAAKATR